MTGKPPVRSFGLRLASILVVLTLLASMTVVTSSCSTLQRSVPTCQGLPRLGLVAQSVPTATFVPCIDRLPAGWSVPSFRVQRGTTEFSLESDRAPDRPVLVRLRARCDVSGAVPATGRVAGVQTYVSLESIDPSYAGVIADVFPGGCVTYRFDFQRGAHITLMQEFESSLRLIPRSTLRLQLHHRYGLELDG